MTTDHDAEQFDAVQAAFLQDFKEMSAFGASPGGGVDRQAGTAEDHAVRAWFDDWLSDRGFRVGYDEIGNQFGLREFVPGAPYVLVGSHLDSQPLAGRFDGAYGVLAAGHAAVRLDLAVASGQCAPHFNVAVVNWFNEEGSRFTPSMMGSSVYTGKLDLDLALASSDRTGVTVAQALEASGVERSLLMPEVCAYAEVHVEQGRLLEDGGENLGLVDRTWAAKKFRVTITGEQGHTGSTVMADRRDALYGASLLIVAARELTEEFPEGALHSSVSELDLQPNSPVTLAREVTINLDLRSAHIDVIDRAQARLEELIEQIQRKARVEVSSDLTHEWGVLDYQREGVELSRAAAEDIGLTHREIMTVAGHDSTNMKDVVPTVMLFVPSVEGVSHNEAELTTDRDMINGVNVLREVLERLVRGQLNA